MTGRDVAEGLRTLGVRPGDILLVHSSVKALGWIPGGPLAVVQALRDAVGEAGTLVVPTQTASNSDPAGWAHPPVPPSLVAVIRADPGLRPRADPEPAHGTPSPRWSGPGRAPDAARTRRPRSRPSARWRRRSSPSTTSTPMRRASPLATLERLEARILLLGATFGSCTAFHLAEYRVPGAAARTTHGAAVLTPTADGTGRPSRTWISTRTTSTGSASTWCSTGVVSDRSGRRGRVPPRRPRCCGRDRSALDRREPRVGDHGPDPRS